MADNRCRYHTWHTKDGVRYVKCLSTTCTNSQLSAPESYRGVNYNCQDGTRAKEYCTNGGVKPGGLFSREKLCEHFHVRD